MGVLVQVLCWDVVIVGGELCCIISGPLIGFVNLCIVGKLMVVGNVLMGCGW